MLKDSSLFTDLYELTMQEGYLKEDHNPKATFDLFVRDLPSSRGYLIAAGLRQVIDFIQDLEFSSDACQFLKEQGFEDQFLDFLRGFEFTGEVRAVPEGTLVFPDEPIIEVTAPIIQAQYLETFLINQVAFQSLIATKAARISSVAKDKKVVDFGSRRAHGTDAGLKAARASYIGGFAGTSNVFAGKEFKLPVFGTMAHSWIESFSSEKKALKKFMKSYQEDSVLLIDTYDTIEGAKKAIQVSRELDIEPRGVRIDSGDLTELSKKVRELLDEQGLSGTGIFLSSGLDEYKIKKMLEDGACAHGFGVGTNLVTSRDAPALEGVYKLVAAEENGELKPKMKLSSGKVTYPGEKQVWRQKKNDQYKQDVLGLRNESEEGESKLNQIFANGNLVYSQPDLRELRGQVKKGLQHLPGKYKRIRDPKKYPVKISSSLQETTDSVTQRIKDEIVN